MTTRNETESLKSHILPHLLGWVSSAIVISLLVATAVMPSWATFWIALPLGVAYVLLVTTPVFLAICSGAGKNVDRL